nr:GrpB family protein [Deinococcus fonticola]
MQGAPRADRRRVSPPSGTLEQQEAAGGKLWPKLVFAPSIGAPRCNIHVRLADTETTRLARLFRDDLRIHPDKVQLWPAFKLKVTAAAPNLSAYGQIKAPAWLLLMELAEVWDRARQEK